MLVGEVWFPAVNPTWFGLRTRACATSLARDLASAKDEVLIREININTMSALYPQKRATSDDGWKKISAAGSFSALSLSFAHELYKELKMPIGILLSAHSNTRVEAFTQRGAIEAHPRLKGDADLMRDADPLPSRAARLTRAITRN